MFGGNDNSMGYLGYISGMIMYLFTLTVSVSFLIQNIIAKDISNIIAYIVCITYLIVIYFVKIRDIGKEAKKDFSLFK